MTSFSVLKVKLSFGYFENIMENGAFAPKSKFSIFHNMFKYMIFQRHYYGVKGKSKKCGPRSDFSIWSSLIRAQIACKLELICCIKAKLAADNIFSCIYDWQLKL